jgi:hypothetical protein
VALRRLCEANFAAPDTLAPPAGTGATSPAAAAAAAAPPHYSLLSALERLLDVLEPRVVEELRRCERDWAALFPPHSAGAGAGQGAEEAALGTGVALLGGGRSGLGGLGFGLSLGGGGLDRRAGAVAAGAAAAPAPSLLSPQEAREEAGRRVQLLAHRRLLLLRESVALAVAGAGT